MRQVSRLRPEAGKRVLYREPRIREPKTSTGQVAERAEGPIDPGLDNPRTTGPEDRKDQRTEGTRNRKVKGHTDRRTSPKDRRIEAATGSK